MKLRKIGLMTNLIGSFLITALIIFFVGVIGWHATRKNSQTIEAIAQIRFPAVQSLLIIENSLKSVESAQKSLLSMNLTESETLNQHTRIQNALLRGTQYVQRYADLPPLAAGKEQWKEFKTNWEKFRKGNEVFIGFSRELLKNGVLNPAHLRQKLETFKGDHFYLIGQVGNMLQTEIEFDGHEDPKQSAFEKWRETFQTTNREIANVLNNTVEPNRRFYLSIGKTKQFIREGDIDGASFTYEAEMLTSANEVTKQLELLNQQAIIAERLYQKLDYQASTVCAPSLDQALITLKKLTDINSEMASSIAETAMNSAKKAQRTMTISVFMGFLAALLFGISISGSITKRINRMIQGLRQSTERLAVAAGRLSVSSLTLAEGASEQTASIEETSSSLEEIASVVKLNVESSDQAHSLMDGTKEIIAEANDSMVKMNSSMKGISKASEETSKIIRTIDEIAFQTNLLALNAAVEAARAGEAGTGFAVVADEVRNLALRAADAAHNTSALIEDTTQKVDEGSALLSNTNEAFSRMTENATTVAALLTEIAAASKEQAQGIEHVNNAVFEMDKVTQQNATNSEESAGASEEMNAQAEQMKGMVNDLVALIQGGAEKVGDKQHRAGAETMAHGRDSGSRSQKNPAGPGKKNSGKVLVAQKSREVKPDQVIPLDDKEFRDF